jgi:DNA replication protein DnaC
MTDLENQIFARYGTPPPTTEKKSETIADIIARCRQNAVVAQKNMIEWNTKTITEYFFTCVNTHVNFRNRQMVLTEDFKESSKKIIGWIDGGHLENRWLLLSGNVGNGKTTAAKAAVSVFQRMGQSSVVIKNAYDISLLYKDIDKKQRAADEYTALSNASILLIDDLGTESNHQSLSEILYNRYNSMLATIFTTNLEYPDLAEKYGDRIFDRFEELVEIVPFKGESFRKKS